MSREVMLQHWTRVPCRCEMFLNDDVWCLQRAPGSWHTVDWWTHAVCIADEAYWRAGVPLPGCWLYHSRLEMSLQVVIELFPGRWHGQDGAHQSQNCCAQLLRRLTMLLRSYDPVLRSGANQNSLSLLTCWKNRWDDIYTALKVEISACRRIFNVAEGPADFIFIYTLKMGTKDCPKRL